MKYPIGIQTFSKIRKEGFVYVDKTEYVYQLAQGAGYYFLSRPRRFGKSLLVSTLEAYFRGQKELFAGLKIGGLETKWEKYPVLTMSFGAGKYDSVDALEEKFDFYLSQWEDEYGAPQKELSSSSRFLGVIQRANAKTGKGVVILIDEYDKPLLQNVDNEKLQDGLRTTMKAFFGALKDQDKYIRFGFITGVTKFSHVSLFSDLNNPNDITLSEQFEAICGITEQELLGTFGEPIKQLAAKLKTTEENTVKRLRKKYDGYCFSSNMTGIYNPFSLMNCFDKLRLGNYWFATGTPTFLVTLLKMAEEPIYDFEGVKMTEDDLGNIENIKDDPIPLFYQAGYLTIRGYSERTGLYTLGYPNEEVKEGFFKNLIPQYTKVRTTQTASIISDMTDAIAAADINTFMRIMKGFFSGNTYELFTKQPIEQYYQTVFYCVTKLLGIQTQAEMHTSCGRVDMLLTTDTDIFIFEFKLNLSADAAINQIEDKHYADQFTADARKIHVIGVNFDPTTRSIKDWKEEK